MPIISGGGGGGSGTVTSVSSANTSIAVATGTTTPVLTVGTFDVLATNSPPAAAVAMNAKKITGLANGTAATDAAAFGQLGIVAAFATQILGAAQATFDTNTILGGNLSAAYSALRVLAMGQTSNAGAVAVTMRFNNDSGANYHGMKVDADSTGVPASTEAIAATSIDIGAMPPSTATGLIGIFIVDIPFYAQTTFNKMATVRGGRSDSSATGDQRDISRAYTWNNTAAINRITLTPGAGNWVAGSSFAVYYIL